MKVEIIPPREMPSVSSLDDPKDFYWVLNSPAPFAGMSFPHSNHWEDLAAVGFRSVVCLTHDTPAYDPYPLEFLVCTSFDDLHGGRHPRDPDYEAQALREIVHGIENELLIGKGVVVHCAGGTGRTGTVIACTLRSLAVPLDEVLDYMQSLNHVREKYPGWQGWPESKWQLEQVKEWKP